MENNWRKKHWEELKSLAGNWIAYERDGDILAWDKKQKVVVENADSTGKSYILHYIHPLDVYEPKTVRFIGVKFLAVRFKSLKKNGWRPYKEVHLSTKDGSKSYEMLVDSGADFSVVDYETGEMLGFQISTGELPNAGEGVGSVIEYVMREVTVTLEGHTFKAGVAWLLDENIVEAILGREVIFDLFDIEFKQADEEVIFKWRGEKPPLT
jgi:hypothetical protein